MLSAHQRRNAHNYSHRAGMLNIGYLAGVVRSIGDDRTVLQIQQSSNLNHSIQCRVDKGKVMPSFVRDGCNIKVLARIRASRHEVTGEPVVVVQCFHFESPSIFDMPPRSAWNRQYREGVPVDDVRPDMYGPEDSDKADHDPETEPERAGLRVSDMGNRVDISGIVASKVLEPPGKQKSEKDGGGKTSGCVIIGLRISADPDEIVPVRVYGHKSAFIHRSIRKGDPLTVIGKLRMRLKNTGKTLEDGVLEVHRFPYIHAAPSDLRVTSTTDILRMPEWAKDMQRQSDEEHRQARAKKHAPAEEASAAGSERVAPAVPGVNAADDESVDAEELDNDLNLEIPDAAVIG